MDRSRLKALFTPTSLRRRIALLLIATFAVMIAVLIGVVVAYIQRAENEAWRARQGDAANSASQAVEQFLQNTVEQLRLFATLGTDELITDPEEISEYMRINLAFQEILLVDSVGRIVATAWKDEALLSNMFTIPQSEWFLMARQGKIYYSDLQIATQGEPYMVISLPVDNGDVLVARVRMTVLWDAMSEVRFGQAGRGYLVDSRGQVVAHTQSAIAISGVNLSDQAYYKEAKAAPGYVWYGETDNWNGEAVVVATAPVSGTPWLVITELPASEAFSLSRSAQLTLFAQMILLGITAGILLSAAMERFILTPIAVLRQAADQVGAGHLDYRITNLPSSELGELMRGFNWMVGRLQEQNTLLERRAAENALRYEQIQGELVERVQAQAALRSLTGEDSHQDETFDYASKELIQALEHEHNDHLMQIKAAGSADGSETLRLIHSRVRNNLQLVASLIKLRMSASNDPLAQAILSEQYNLMRPLLHSHAGLVESSDLQPLNARNYLTQLAQATLQAHTASALPIELQVDAEGLSIDLITSIPLGLILNELIANALTHAFPNRLSGKINILFCSVRDDDILFELRDDGIGFPYTIISQPPNSTGLQLVSLLTTHLHGNMQITNRQGACIQIQFPNPLAKA